MVRRPTRALAALAALIAVATGCAPGGAATSPSADGSAAPAPSSTRPPAVTSSPANGSSIPLFAYYYMWYQPRSWTRAKIDSPQLGSYSSDDPAVVRQHIRWARSAGIDGFILSWKDTATYARRIRLLTRIADEQHFSLAMIYEGLDFSRHPLPTAQVARDFRAFARTYASDPAFYRVGGRVLTIWSGTWMFSHDDVAAVTRGVQDRLLVLATAKSTQDYLRTADVTDGDAYYWSSVNPVTNAKYGEKLDAMAKAVHAHGQYWIAPFAPGFDARLVGGTKVVPRDNGATLRTEYTTAVASSPDMLGLISWNEWSENSYVEPSRSYGTTELDVLRSVRHTATPLPPSSAGPSSAATPAEARLGASEVSGSSATSAPSPWPNLLLIAGLVVLLLLGGAVARWRMRPERAQRPPPPDVSARRPNHLSHTRDSRHVR